MKKDRIHELADHLETVVDTQYIKAEPGRGVFNMNTWFHADQNKSDEYECQTPACICGHALHYFDHAKYVELCSIGSAADWEGEGAKVLGLSKEMATELFCPNEDFYTEAYGIDAAEAAGILRNLAETGKVDWTDFEGDPNDDY
ncbi:MAG: hypothetical protein OXC41_01870 [Gammaproteobacteria bacterium]|nr:hypothetical protein [Gammaproteobacteria bacterium]